jgi:hypothetical protein
MVHHREYEYFEFVSWQFPHIICQDSVTHGEESAKDKDRVMSVGGISGNSVPQPKFINVKV